MSDINTEASRNLHYLLFLNYFVIFVLQDYTVRMDRIKEARLSFPSGHASFAFQAAVFTILFLQSKYSAKLKMTRSSIEQSSLIIPFLQVIALSLATFTAVSRIMDYKHHPTDVLAGLLIGITSQSLNFFAFNRFYGDDDTKMVDTVDINESTYHPLLYENSNEEFVTRRRRSACYDSIEVEA